MIKYLSAKTAARDVWCSDRHVFRIREACDEGRRIDASLVGSVGGTSEVSGHQRYDFIVTTAFEKMSQQMKALNEPEIVRVQ